VVEFTSEDLSAEEVQRLRGVYGPLADAVRALVDATIRTEVDPDTVVAATAEIEAVTARLRARQLDGAFGVRMTREGERMPWGNAVIGLRNAIAPPLRVHKDGAGRAWADFELGAAYEGPPGHVHGGVVALMLDHILGEVTADGALPRFTGTLTIRYRRATPLGPLRAEGRLEREDGIKAWATGRILDAEGVTAEAEGVFITPRWARAAR